MDGVIFILREKVHQYSIDFSFYCCCLLPEAFWELTHNMQARAEELFNNDNTSHNINYQEQIKEQIKMLASRLHFTKYIKQPKPR